MLFTARHRGRAELALIRVWVTGKMDACSRDARFGEMLYHVGLWYDSDVVDVGAAYRQGGFCSDWLRRDAGSWKRTECVDPHGEHRPW